MPRDQDFGEDLATRMTAKYHGRIGDVEFTYDSYLELDQLDNEKPYCKISPNNYDHQREARFLWREQISLELSLVSKVGPADGKWVGDWLESWDVLIRDVREEPLFDKHKPMSIDIDERYDANLFHNNRRLLTQATLHYQNVEVI